MKKVLFAIAMVAMVAVSCDKNENENEGTGATLKVLTFEDADYKAGENYIGGSSWSSLIADPEYNSDMLYGYDDTWVGHSEYEWSDLNNTELSGEVYESEWGYGRSFMSGGIVVSNYYKEVVSGTAVDYSNELSVSNGSAGAAGNNGSANFAIINDGAAGGMGVATYLSFGDNTARTIDHLYISSTSYLESVAMDGNYLSAALGESDTFTITATGYDASDVETESTSYELAVDGALVKGWNKWDLSSLGDVAKVKFAITSSVGNDYGITLPAYVAIDDIAVVFE